uniref:Ubiquitin carboxyl-terminal hydrolase n=1 Tax=Arcella intermedia TaxID=1963864 RepID=A0A6B2KY99_9EUKA
MHKGDETNPKERLRDPLFPVGLRNVGNTCYVNSLLQTYFMIPALRELVLNTNCINTDELPEDDLNIKRHKTFMRELQFLFGRMILSNEKYVDPTNVLNAIVDKDGRKVLAIGQQQDLGEFMDLFSSWLETGLTLCGYKSDFFKETFEIPTVDLITAKEENGEIVEANSESLSRFIMLDVKFKDLNRAVDEALIAKADWTTPKKFATQAEKRTWMTKIPQVLMFQEHRVEYSVIEKRPTKNNAEMTFDKEIDLARCLRDNEKQTTELRALLNSHYHNLENLEKENVKLANVPKSFETLLTLINKEDAEAQHIAPITKEVQVQLEERLKFYKNRIEDNEAKIKDYKSQIGCCYKQITGLPYSLYGVWIHSGPNPGSGHYWVYIRNFNDNSWIKYNDTNVTFVDEKTVMEHAVGRSDISAYFLIYISKSIEETLKGKQLPTADIVPDFIKNVVETENQDFIDLLKKSEKPEPQTPITKALPNREETLFIDQFKETVGFISNEIRSPTDYRISSFGLFLKGIFPAEKQFCISWAFHYIWKQRFGDQVLDITKLESIKTHLSKIPEVDAKELGSFLVSNFSQDAMFKKIYHQFLYYNYYISEGLKEFHMDFYTLACKYFVGAVKCSMSFQQMQTVSTLLDVKALLRVSLIAAITSGITSNRDADLRSNIMVIRNVFDNEWASDWVNNLRELLFNAAFSAEPNDMQSVIQFITDLEKDENYLQQVQGEINHFAYEDTKVLQGNIIKEYSRFLDSPRYHQVHQQYNVSVPDKPEYHFPF